MKLKQTIKLFFIVITRESFLLVMNFFYPLIKNFFHMVFSRFFYMYTFFKILMNFFM
ncbi:hypothetical protein GLOIN_2v1627167 [Rhizophagus irregularis DAOM 181602=DAOM 197198]|uniref:Uncharacterized protein n=1 Tax=Rhizophagus irregularis (strain DAOM 181602 / DAOM 197198 / MUCL 43194) TaxID=747089 RepID=A0A2P4PVI0_RHIID|nr:hypothetical protein GLOIN_2v1627167 [Rhizophagus irregularis DAOM 181602=DAOM 197198]POG69384.1 hypothetical protein GLOIN_2v1627167 [Rhizophagus irregularis DAOM 181602=DAOM 197198]|eukprot:XP_025176250.1 hypothetical protein GLOIN_2v1627167 [Rhizophagus irregularis DAOM 181602=DAOM 197198]